MSKKATIIAVVNQKGGTGKTTTTENLGVGLALEGKKVLLVDTDPQASLTVSLGNPYPDDLSPTLSDLMGKIMMEKPIAPGEGILHHPEGVDLVPSNIELSGIAVKGSALIFLLWRSTSMDRIFMDEYYEHLRADNIEEFSKERNDEYVGRAEEYEAAKSALLEGLGLEHLFDHSHELTPKEKAIWMLFDRVYVAELLARDAFAKGAYMLGAEDREIMLK